MQHRNCKAKTSLQAERIQNKVILTMSCLVMSRGSFCLLLRFLSLFSLDRILTSETILKLLGMFNALPTKY